MIKIITPFFIFLVNGWGVKLVYVYLYPSNLLGSFLVIPLIRLIIFSSTLSQ